MYQSLDPARIIETLRKLQGRIEKRFPASGLGKVCAELLTTAETSSAEAAALSERNWPLRIAVGAIVVLGVVAQFAAA